MELYLKISYLNDFIFCPLSIYYHQLYGDLSERMYYGSSQLDGKAAHSAIDEQGYSTHKNILQGMDILFTMIFVTVHLFQKHIAMGFSYKLGKSLSILKALNLGQVSEKDFWKNQNQYILPWKNSKKNVGLILEALMEYKNEFFIYLQSYYRAFMRDRQVEEFPFFNMNSKEE